jgi:hypothetical protein
MSFLIGGFSAQQYSAYLNPTSESSGCKSSRWFSYFNLTRYPVLAIFVNRLAYFILHRFSAFPNNAYLFDKFKSHDFSSISEQKNYKIAKDIFESFKKCPELKKTELTEIEVKLNSVEKRFITPSQVKENPGDDADIRENEENEVVIEPEEPFQKDKQPLSSNDSRSQDKGQEKELDSNPNRNTPCDEEVSEPEIEDNQSLVPKEDQLVVYNEFSSEDSTQFHLRDLFESIQSQLREEQKEDPQVEVKKILDVIPEPLPTEVKEIVSNPFPLDESQSLDHLFREDQTKDTQHLYRKNLSVLLRFENKLRVEEKNAPKEPSFEEYLRQADKAFEKAWQTAHNQCRELHEEFKQTFRENSPYLQDNGDVICTAGQFDWVISRITDRFPAIYQLAFDAPSFEIYQSRRMAYLAQLILIGPDVKAKEISSPCFIGLLETLDKATAPVKNLTEKNPLIKAGSYIYTHVVGSIDQSEDKEIIKQQLGKLTKAYVKDWLERRGAFLKFGDHTIVGGESTGAIKAADWVACVRDVYTQTLLDMNQEELKKEIENLSTCPLIGLIAKTYADDIDEEVWTQSNFPAVLMKNLFKDELQRTSNTVHIRLAIHQTIKDASFSKTEDIQILAEKADCSTQFIEPLIRIRVLYMMGCLGQTAIEPAVVGTNKRAKTMFDPVGLESQVLSCQSSEERVLSFDDHFDQLTIKVKTVFKDPNKPYAVAQGHSSFVVDSVNRSNEEEIKTKVIDLQDLRFSLYASETQRHYLTAQIAPETLIENIKKLEKETADLEYVKKAERYQEDKKQHEVDNNQKWSWNKSEFDSKPYRDLEKDSQHLDQAIRKARNLVSYLNTQMMLSYCSQLTSDQLNSFEQSSNQICNQLNSAFNAYKDLYSTYRQVHSSEEFDNKVTQLGKLLSFTKEQVRVIRAESEGHSGSSSVLGDEKIKGVNDFNGRVIGQNAGKEKKGIITALWDYSFGYFTKETSEVKYIKWKIERYEDLISGMQKNLPKYLQEAGFNIEELLIQARDENAAEWIKQLFPVLKLCQKELRIDNDRFNPDYLLEVRKSYTEELLGQLRKAAIWAKEHSDQEGVEHLDAACYQLYAALDLNQRCQEVFKTFTSLGQECLKEPAHSHALPENDSRYDLIRGLHTAHQQIKAVPTDAKAPLLKQWANSARGHLNGIPGWTDFDPNMQSNPMHVLLEKKITTKGKNSEPDSIQTVKDIGMGSPTIETGNGKAEINPEFLAFLRHCKRKGLVHFYINNQDFIPKAWINGDESVRCQTLHDPAENEFKGTFYAITLSQNSSFYQQKGHQLSSLNVRKVKNDIITQLLNKSKEFRHYLPSDLINKPEFQEWMAGEIDRLHQQEFNHCSDFKDEKDREAFVRCFHAQLHEHVKQLGFAIGYSIYDPAVTHFKNEMIAQMFDRTPHVTGNYIPKDLVDRFNLREWSINVVNQIHEKMFAGRESLTIEEHRIFIRLFYQNLSRKILIETKANSYNSSCKDRIDRGAATDAEDFAYLAILANCMNRPGVIEFFKMLVFARAIIVRKRTIIEERLERLIETVKFMLTNQAQLQELHNQLFPDIEITVDQFLESKEVSLQVESLKAEVDPL